MSVFGSLSKKKKTAPEPDAPEVDEEEPLVRLVLDAWGQGAPATSVAKFIASNPELSTIKKKRDAKGVFKWLEIAIFGYLLFSPVLVLLPTMKEPAVVVVLWVIVGLLMLSKIEYTFRGELWLICLCRGVIVDMPKTDKLPRWLCSPPVLLALLFLLLYAIVGYVGLDPDFKFDRGSESSPRFPVVVVVLGLLGILFILLLAKSAVDVEGATGTLSLNLVLTYFNDPALLATRGFTTVHLSQIMAFVKARRADQRPFSWDDVHALPSQAVKIRGLDHFLGGVKAVRYLKPNKNLNA